MVELDLELEPRLESGGHARQYLAERLRDQLGDALDPLLTVVSELVNNSVLYGPGKPIQVSVVAHPDGRVIGEVKDQGDGKVAIREITEVKGGLVLYILDGLSKPWSVRKGSTTIRFE